MRRIPLTLLVTGLLAGCTKKATEPPLAHPPVTRPGPATRPSALPSSPAAKVARRADAVAAAAIYIHPRRWPRLAAALRPLVAALPGERDAFKRQLLDLLDTPDLWSAARSALRLGRPGLALPARLDGWDPDRPLELELYDPIEAGDLGLAARLLTITPSVSWVPGSCHRLRLPATDVPTASASLRGLLEGAGLKPARTRDGRAGVLYRSRDALAAVLPEPDHVRVEVCEEPAVLPGKSVDVGEIWEREVLLAPGRGGLPDTPARRLVRAGQALAAVHLRPWVFADVSQQVGASQIVQALTHVEPEIRAPLLAAGLAEVAIGRLLMTPIAAEVDDATFALDADTGKLRMTAVWSLTEQGQRVYRAATRNVTSTFPAVDREAVLRGLIALDVPAMLNAAQPHPLFASIKRPEELVRPLHKAGYWGMLHASVRHQVSLLQALARVSPAMRHPLAAQVPRALSVTVRGPERLAAAVSVTAGQDVGRTRTELLGLLARIGPRGLTVHVRRSGEIGALLLGLGMDPRRAFGRRPRRGPADVLADFEVNANALRRLARRKNPLAAASLAPLAGVRIRLSLRGRALVGQLEVRLAGNRASDLSPPPDLATGGWTSPGLARAASPGGRCLARTTAAMVRAYDALAHVAPESKTELLLRALDEASRELRCAARDPLTRDEARELHWLVTMFQADQLGGLFRRAEQLALLRRACSQGMQAACARERAVEATPHVQLPSLATSCGERHFPALFGPGDRAHFTVTADGELRRGEVGPWQPLLAADRGAPARAVVRAVDAAGRRCPVWILFRGSGGLRELQVVSSKHQPPRDEAKRAVREIRPPGPDPAVRVSQRTWEQALEAICKGAGRGPVKLR